VPWVGSRWTEGSKPIDDSPLLEDEQTSLCSSQAGEAKLVYLVSGEDPMLEQIQAEV
jgi:hypothetical protein